MVDTLNQLRAEGLIRTIFCGGASDSLHPRKTHALNEHTGKPLCGQHIRNWETVDTDEINRAEYIGRAACGKCLRKLEMQEAAAAVVHESTQ